VRGLEEHERNAMTATPIDIPDIVDIVCDELGLDKLLVINGHRLTPDHPLRVGRVMVAHCSRVVLGSQYIDIADELNLNERTIHSMAGNVKNGLEEEAEKMVQACERALGVRRAR